MLVLYRRVASLAKQFYLSVLVLCRRVASVAVLPKDLDLIVPASSYFCFTKRSRFVSPCVEIFHEVSFVSPLSRVIACVTLPYASSESCYCVCCSTICVL